MKLYLHISVLSRLDTGLATGWSSAKSTSPNGKKIKLDANHIIIIIFIVYLTTLFQYLRLSVDVVGKPAASAQFLLNPDSSASARAIQ
jgi:hypothetical protein